jgi:hypothetical protein
MKPCDALLSGSAKSEKAQFLWVILAQELGFNHEPMKVTR